MLAAPDGMADVFRVFVQGGLANMRLLCNRLTLEVVRMLTSPTAPVFLNGEPKDLFEGDFVILGSNALVFLANAFRLAGEDIARGILLAGLPDMLLLIALADF